MSSSCNCRLGEHLERAVANELPAVVRLVRTPKRSGLIRARLFGAQQAVGEVLVFLDSHIEANLGWLPPLLKPIQESQNNVMTPIIDNIEKQSLEYHGHRSPGESVGIFNWGLEFKWGPPKNRPSDLSEPFAFEELRN